MKRVSTLSRREKQGEFSRCRSVMLHTEKEAANAAKENAVGLVVPSNVKETDVWADESGNETDDKKITESSYFHGLGAEDEDIFAVQEQQPETNEHEEVNDALKDFLDCIKQVKGHVTEDVQAVSRELAKHSIGVTSAKSFAELQHHVNEIVQLSGPELGCAWSTVKVGVGVASVLSGNLLVGSFMVALAAGSLGTSLVWKAHRDSQRNPEASSKTEENAERSPKKAEDAATKGCVSSLGDRDNRGSDEQSFSRHNKVKRYLKLEPDDKYTRYDAQHKGAAEGKQLTEYDAWSVQDY